MFLTLSLEEEEEVEESPHSPFFVFVLGSFPPRLLFWWRWRLDATEEEKSFVMGVERSAKKNRQTQQKNAPQCKSFLGSKTGESISCTGSFDAVLHPKMLVEKRRRCKREFFIFLGTSSLGNSGKW